MARITHGDEMHRDAGGAGTDEKIKVSSNDTTAGYLNGKLVAGTNITLTENSDGGDETLTIESTAVGGGGGFDPATQAYIYDECFYRGPATDSLTVPPGAIYEGGMYALINSVASGSEVQNGVTPLADSPGMIGLRAQGTSSRAALVQGPNLNGTPHAGGFIGGRVVRFGAILMTQVLSSGTQRYELVAGFANHLSTYSNGLFFRYRDDENAGNWSAVKRIAGVETTADTGITVTTNTLYRLEIETDAAWSTATYYINGTQVATHSTLPSAASTYGMVISNQKIAGTTARFTYVDAFWLDVTLTR